MLPAPRIVWLMVPAGDATEATMEEFAALLSPGDTIVDGGNANFQDSKRRHALLKARGIRFVDAGISRRRLGPRPTATARWSAATARPSSRSSRSSSALAPPRAATSTAGRPARATT